jgi:hypothetical protein
MSVNRRRHANVVPVASITMWISICAFAGAAGLGYVSLKNQLHAGADEMKNLERETEQVLMRISVVKTEVQKLSSLDALKKRYDADRGKLGGLVEIQPDRIVWVDRPIPSLAADVLEIQQTSNLKR